MDYNDKITLLHSLAKELKCEYIVVKGNYIYGTDENFVHVTYIKHNEIDLWDFQDKFISYRLLSAGEIEIIDNFKRNKFIQLISNISMLETFPVSTSHTNIDEREDFKAIMNKKAGEGLTNFCLDDKHILFISKSLVPINKKDKLNIDVREVDKNKFLAEFIISKGKMVLHKFYMFMHLNDKKPMLM